MNLNWQKTRELINRAIKINKFCLFAFIAIILIISPALIILSIPAACGLRPTIPTITACITLLLGWAFTYYQNSINFFRAETVKHKDKLISLVEELFDDFIEKLESRTFNEQERITFINDKVSNLEFKHSIQQKIYGNKAVIFLSDSTFANLRMMWKYDEEDYKKHKRKLQDFKEDTLQEIENNYINWLK